MPLYAIAIRSNDLPPTENTWIVFQLADSPEEAMEKVEGFDPAVAAAEVPEETT